MSDTGKPNPNSGLSHDNLPRFLLHGFEATQGTADARAIPSAGKIREYISELPPLYSEQVTTRLSDGTIREQARTSVDYVKEGYLGLDLNDADKAYVKTDIDQSLDLTKFMVNCQWETTTTAPYANATAVFTMPSQLIPFLFHGEIADQGDGKTPGFRFIEAGGWASIRFPYIFEGNKDKGKSYRTVFFGKILAINVNTSINTTSVFNSVVSITVGSFIQPITLGETRKTYKRAGNISQIDPGAIGTYDAEQNVILKGLVNQMRQMRSGANGVDMYDSLRYFIKSFGHMEVPTDLAGRDKSLKKPQRLGDNIHIMGEYQETTVGTIYSANAADINTIQGRPEEKYFASGFMSNGTTMWGLIQSMFQPSSELIELFPVLIPLSESGEAIGLAAGAGTNLVAPTAQEYINDDIVNSLQAVLYIMYRYKPMPPTFYGDKNSVDSNNRRKAGLRPNVVGAKTNHHKFFGTHNTVDVYSRATDEKNPDGTAVTEEKLEVNDWSPEFLYLNEGQVTSMDLTWSDVDRFNAVNMSLPHAEGQTGSNLLFGVECVPVFNQEDINRHGLRMKNLHTPFASSATSEHIKAFNRDASSGMAERLYYLIGEGHAYGRGQINLVYTPNPSLTAGVWCQTHFMATQPGGDARITGSGNPNSLRSKPLTYYVTAVRHTVSVDPTTGMPSGYTSLTVERASYGNRIPALALNQVPRQIIPPPPKDTRRKGRRRKNRKVRR
jgi:hypothetical protein